MKTTARAMTASMTTSESTMQAHDTVKTIIGAATLHAKDITAGRRQLKDATL